MAASIPKERGRMILESRKKQGTCLTCDPVPEDRVSAEAIWNRAKNSPVPYRVRIDKD